MVNDILDNILCESLKQCKTNDKVKPKIETDGSRQCNYCEKGFHWMADLILHMLQEHKPPVRPYVVYDG